jgi:hypothetical protein
LAAGIEPAASHNAAEFQRICDRFAEGGAAQGMTEEKLAEILDLDRFSLCFSLL